MPIIAPPYDSAISVRKAGASAGWGIVALLITTLGAALLEPSFVTDALALAKDYPKVGAAMPLVFMALRFGFAYWRDYVKHKDPAPTTLGVLKEKI